MATLIPPTDVRTRIAVQKQNAKLTSNLTSDQLVYWNDGRLSSVSNLTSWIAGTTNEIDIATSSDVLFTSVVDKEGQRKPIARAPMLFALTIIAVSLVCYRRKLCEKR